MVLCEEAGISITPLYWPWLAGQNLLPSHINTEEICSSLIHSSEGQEDRLASGPVRQHHVIH